MSTPETDTNSAAARREPDDLARSKLVQIYRYLQALNELRNPVQRRIEDQPWVTWLRELPDHPCVRRGSLDGLADDDFVLKVGRPDLSTAPPPPQQIVDWLHPGWDRIDGSVVTLPTRDEEVANDISRSILFEDAPERVRLLGVWTLARDEWVETETIARQALALFERLYALRARIERETERVELVVGDGLLEWDTTDGNRIRHPVLLQKVELQFEPAIPEFTIVETEHAVELYTALFSSMPDVQPQFVNQCQTEVDEAGVDPLGGDDTDQFLTRLVTRVSPRGAFVEAEESSGVATDPRMSRAAALFLRNRTLGLGKAIEDILKDLENREDLPDAVTRIVGIEREPEADPLSVVSLADPWNGQHQDIYFSKEANAEQLEIAQRLERYGSVLVQGPPGTGKTHTIANLLGHLLAEGKSVLVTSHTAKALAVLRDKVVGPLQPLCLSVGVPIRDASTGVESETYSRKLMENAIDEITERLSSASAPALMKDAELLEKQRLGLFERLRAARLELQAARQDEYRPVVFAGTDYAPAQAARQVAAGKFQNAWIPTPVTLGDPLPLTPGEIADLYQSNTAVTGDDETELSGSLPAVADLISPPDFTRFAEERLDLLESDLETGRNLWGDTAATGGDLREILSATIQAVEPIDDGAPWRIAAIAAGREGGQVRAAWEGLLQQVDDVVVLAAEAEEALHRFGPGLPAGMASADAYRIAQEICKHLAGGRSTSSARDSIGRLSLALHGNWKTFIEAARVSDRSPDPPKSSQHSNRSLACSLRANYSWNAGRDRCLRWARHPPTSSANAPSQLAGNTVPRSRTVSAGMTARGRLCTIGSWTADFYRVRFSTQCLPG